ncbi:hypothetical protein QQZ08_002853 [Neonectria magnoliae]|uniref:Uncharacterized protein n=1 Tax=Neonectria magnoliae TaxID=2732573 RepID=A0ABR1ICJ7_9HYPO
MPPSHDSSIERSSPHKTITTNTDKVLGQESATRNANDTNIKLLTNLICEKVSWMQKKESAEKRLEKLRADHERSGTKHVDFPSVVEMFQSQIKTATSDLITCTKQIFTIDERLKTEFGHLSPSQILPGLAGQTGAQEKQESATKEPVTKAPSNSDKQPTQSRDPASESLKSQLDNELSLFKRNVEQSIRELKAQSENASKANRRLELENEKLKASQDEMKRKFEQMEENFTKLDQTYDGDQTKVNYRIDAMHEQVKAQMAAIASETKIKTESKVSDAQLEKAIKEQDDKVLSVQGRLDPVLTDIKLLKTEISSQLAALEEKQASISKKVEQMPTMAEQNNALSDLKTHLSDQEFKIDFLGGKVTALQPLASDGISDKMKQVVDKVSKIQERLDLDKASANADSMTEEKVRAIIAPALVKVEKDIWPKLHQRLDKVAEGLGGFLDKERIAREATKSQVQELADQVMAQADRITALTDQVKSLSQAVDGVKAEHERSKEAMETQNQIRGRDDEFRNHNIASLRSQVDGMDQELKKGQEALQMQLLHLSTWMNNFNTRRLYSDIVNHITATIPNSVGISNQMRELENRLSMLESREDGDNQSGMKKRKAPNGTAVTVNNGH